MRLACETVFDHSVFWLHRQKLRELAYNNPNVDDSWADTEFHNWLSESMSPEEIDNLITMLDKTSRIRS